MALNQAAEDQQADRYEGDPWDELILRWAEARESVSISEILTGCLEKKKDMWTQADKVRIARALRTAGWIRFYTGPRSAREWWLIDTRSEVCSRSNCPRAIIM